MPKKSGEHYLFYLRQMIEENNQRKERAKRDVELAYNLKLQNLENDFEAKKEDLRIKKKQKITSIDLVYGNKEMYYRGQIDTYCRPTAE